MTWPNHADYSEAVQNPELCFELPELQTGEVATTALGLPRALSGNFATVYEVTGGGETHAVRCFIRQVTNQQARYAALERYFGPLELPFIVPFEFVERGIRVGDQQFPIVKMAWVAGVPLHTWLEQQLAAKEQIAWLAADWRDLMRQLKEHRIGHGDLQHGNVLVTAEGELKLVDYDGVYVPLFARERSPELGHANYQHPQRGAGFYDERLDHFPGLLVYLSLRALAAEPALWTEYFNGDNLLATAVDLRVPRCSGLWPRLLESPDDDVRRLTVLLTDYLRVPPEDVPDLETVLNERLAEICVPSQLEFADPEPLAPIAEEGELETTFLARARKPPAGPLAAMDIERHPGGSRPSVMLPRFVDVFAWSALVTALLALVPMLSPVAGAAAIALGLLAWLMPGRRGQRGHWVASFSMLLGLWLLLNPPGLQVEARLQLPDPQPPLPVVNVPDVDSVAPPQPLEQPGETPAVSSPEQSAGSPTHALLEGQAVSRPLLPPKTRPFVQLLDRWPAHGQPITSLGLTSDGRHVIAATKDRFLGFREIGGGRTVFSRTNLAEPVLAIHSLTNVGIVATVDAMHGVHWWSIDGGVLLKSLPVNADSVFLPVLAPDGNSVAVGGGERRSVALHLDRSPVVSRTIPGFTSWVKLVRFFPHRPALVVVGHDDSLAVAEIESGQIRQRMAFPDAGVVDVSFSPRGAGLLAVGAAGQLRCWNLEVGRLVGERPAQGRTLAGAGFANAGRHLVVAGTDGELELLALSENLPLLARFDAGESITAIHVSPDGSLLATGDEQGEVCVWKLEAEPDAVVQVARP